MNSEPLRPYVQAEDQALLAKHGLTRLSYVKVRGPRLFHIGNVFAQGSLNIIGGKSGGGKSGLIKCLMAATVSESRAELFGWSIRNPDRRPVVWIGFEEDEHSATEPFEAMGLTEQEIFRIILPDFKTDKWSPDTLRGTSNLLRKVVTDYHPVSMYIDPILDMQRLKGDINVAFTELRSIMKDFWDIAHKTDTCIIGTAHTGKGDRRGIDAIMGNTGFVTAIDRGLLFRGEPGEMHYLSSVKNRGTYGPAFSEFSVLYDPSTYWVSRGADVVESKDSHRRIKVFTILDAVAPRELNQTQLLEKLAGKQYTDRKILEAMAREGLIKARGNKPILYSVSLEERDARTRQTMTSVPSCINDETRRTLSGGVSTTGSKAADLQPTAMPSVPSLVPDRDAPQPAGTSSRNPFRRRMALPIEALRTATLEQALSPRSKGRIVSDEEV